MAIETLPESSLPVTRPLRPGLGFLTATPIIAGATICLALVIASAIFAPWLTSHDPHGRWLYGADVGTHPAYRRRGIARALYAARHATVRALDLDGQVTVGMPSGYGALATSMSAEQYYAELLAGTRTDPTISAQRAIGFEPHGLIPGYIDDPVCAGYGVLLLLPAARDVPLPAGARLSGS